MLNLMVNAGTYYLTLQVIKETHSFMSKDFAASPFIETSVLINKTYDVPQNIGTTENDAIVLLNDVNVSVPFTNVPTAVQKKQSVKKFGCCYTYAVGIKKVKVRLGCKVKNVSVNVKCKGKTYRAITNAKGACIVKVKSSLYKVNKIYITLSKKGYNRKKCVIKLW